jgi:predicted transporter
MEDDGRRWFWALAIACPTCAGSVVLAPFLAAGATAAAAKIAVASLAGGTLAVAWAANAWSRRGEGSPA